MLRILIRETSDELVIQPEGRLAGPWVAELSRTWLEIAPRLAPRKLSIDLRELTYADATGKQALKEIYLQAGANFVASTPWTHYLAQEIVSHNPNRTA